MEPLDTTELPIAVELDPDAVLLVPIAVELSQLAVDNEPISTELFQLATFVASFRSICKSIERVHLLLPHAEVLSGIDNRKAHEPFGTIAISALVTEAVALRTSTYTVQLGVAVFCEAVNPINHQVPLEAAVIRPLLSTVMLVNV